MSEGRPFTIYTDHKPLVTTFMQRSDKATRRQIRNLDYISQFSTDIQYIAGKQNIPADFLSRIETIDFLSVLDFEKLQEHQDTDQELKHLLSSSTNLVLNKLQFSTNDTFIYCDASTNNIHPYIPTSFRRAVFNTIHNLAHQG